jgi:hypothetical protein
MKPIILIFLLIFNPFFVFSQDSGEQPEGLELVLARIVWFFTSIYVKAFCIIALGALALGLIMNRGEPGVVKKFIPWMAAVMILRSIGGINAIL